MKQRAGWVASLVAVLISSLITAPASSQTSLPGDANCDGHVDAADAAAEIAAIFGVGTDCPNVDPDGDGRLTAADLVAIIQSLGLPSPPTPTPTATVTPTATETRTSPPTTATLTPTISSGMTPSPGTVTFADIQTQIFDSNDPPGTGCTNVGCHSGPFPQASLSLETGQSYENLVGVQPSTVSAKNRGLLRVDPGNLSNSFLWLKVTGFEPNVLERGDGAPMPSGSVIPLSQQKLDLLKAWIVEGAPQ